MRNTITLDAAGRFVLPKSIRDRLHLRTGSILEAEIVSDKIQLTPAANSDVKMVRKGKRLVLAKTGVPFDAATAIQAEHHSMETLGTKR